MSSSAPPSVDTSPASQQADCRIRGRRDNGCGVYGFVVDHDDEDDESGENETATPYIVVGNTRSSLKADDYHLMHAADCQTASVQLNCVCLSEVLCFASNGLLIVPRLACLYELPPSYSASRNHTLQCSAHMFVHAFVHRQQHLLLRNPKP